jgi:hypothetical protein
MSPRWRGEMVLLRADTDMVLIYVSNGCTSGTSRVEKVGFVSTWKDSITSGYKVSELSSCTMYIENLCRVDMYTTKFQAHLGS